MILFYHFPSSKWPLFIVNIFIITKGGWVLLYKILNQYKMAMSHDHFCDIEGFFSVFRRRDKVGSKDHEPYFPEDIIRNEFSLQEQEIKKEKWRVYSRVLEFIHCFDDEYKPLDDAKIEANKS